MSKPTTSPEKAGYTGGPGVMPGRVELPTCQIPHDCTCSWTVSRPGPGAACLSVLRHASLACPHYREHSRQGAAEAERMRAARVAAVIP